jgi:exopolysaccharide biosynthesis polyprenyl glycosylphosphotransferase
VIQSRKRAVRFRHALGRAALDGSTSGWDGGAGIVMPRPVETAAGRMSARKHKLVIMLLVQLAIFICLWLAARFAVGVFYPGEDFLSYRLVLPLVLFFFSYFLLAWRSVYSRDYHYYLRRAHGTVLKNGVFPVILACLASLVLGTWTSDPFPLVVTLFAAGFMSFAFVDGCQNLWIRYLSRLGYFRKKILVIGRTGLRHSVDSRMRDFGSTKIFAGEIDRTNGAWVWKPADGRTEKVVKGFSQIRTIILKENIGDILLFPGGSSDQGFEQELVQYCQSQSIGYYLVPEKPGTLQTGIASLFFPNIPVSERFAGPRDSLTAISAKRLLDIAISLFCLALFFPVGLLIILAILLQDGLPVFYVSSRVGKNGRRIRFLKFRTMVRDADMQKEKLLPFNARSDGPLFKMKNDPRVTAIGGVLRRYSLDELPQFLNVLLGSMSLVGPRPHLPQEVAQYREGDYLRLECMPGIVGLPQVSPRNTTMGFREWVDLDLSYRRGWSLALDMGIILKTASLFLRALFSRPGSDHY